MNAAMSQLLLVALALALLVAAATDLRSRTISNGLNLAIALGAPFFWWASGLGLWPDAALQLGLAAIVFGLFTAAFAFGWMGGGDVKLLGALALWLPAVATLKLLVVMSLAGGALTLVMLLLHRLRRSAGELEIPYGVAISFAGLWVIYERYLNQFT